MAVTIKQIAKEVGVSHPVVSKVLSGGTSTVGVSPTTRRRIEAAARTLGYRPNAAARAMARRRTRQIGVLVPNSPDNRFTHPLAYETVLGINEGLQSAGYVMCLARIDDVKRDLADQSRVFKENVLDGMIVLDSMPHEVEQRLETLISDVVWCDSDVWRDVACVRRDEREAGRLAGQAVLSRGYRDVRFLGYREDHDAHFSFIERAAGLAEVLGAEGIEVQPCTEPMLGHDASRHAMVRSLRADTVLVCNSIYQAHAVRSAAEELGHIPGKDFQLISCDDMHQLDRMWPGLSRVSFDRHGMGLEAASLMLGVLERGASQCESKLIRSEWIPGRTLG